MGEFLHSWMEIYFINAKAQQWPQYSAELLAGLNNMDCMIFFYNKNGISDWKFSFNSDMLFELPGALESLCVCVHWRTFWSHWYQLLH